MSVHPVLINGEWRAAKATKTFRAENPKTGEPMADEYPVSSWEDVDAALAAAEEAFAELLKMPASRIAEFLRAYAARLEKRSEEICRLADEETALGYSPRLKDVEMPRTVGQLRQAADAAENGSWSMPTIDTNTGIRAYFAALGPVAVFGPNNFPLAFGSVSGGDFAAALAAGNPVIGKANSLHPGTTRLFAEEAQLAAEETKMPAGLVQLLYRTDHKDGERFVSDPRLGATGYTGSRSAGLKLKAAADAVGKPIYLELSSVNPVVFLPGVIAERGNDLADEFCTSCLMGTGQFCTNPGLVLVIESAAVEQLIEAIATRFKEAPVGTLLSQSGSQGLKKAIDTLQQAGAQLLAGGSSGGGQGASFANTLLRVPGKTFVENPHELQTEAFGNASLIVVAKDLGEAEQVLAQLEGNLTGCIYSSRQGEDDAAYAQLAPVMRRKVGRLLNDKMPTGVAVSPAMNHGGPFPATGHPGFTAVGIPASLRRFAMLQSFDQVREDRLPSLLRDANSAGTWRLIDGEWTTADVTAK